MTIIQRKDGKIYDLEEAGLRTRDIIVSAPNPKHIFGGGEGMHGVIDYGTTYDARDITGVFTFKAIDYIDFALLRDEVFNLFKSDDSFYLHEERTGGKRWLVKVNNSYDIPQTHIYGDFNVEFIGLKGFAESEGTTQDIERGGISSDIGLWGFGMQLTADDETLVYTHEGSSFRIYNAGNVPIHPFNQDLKIIISNVKGSSNSFELKNETNGSTFKVNNGVTSNQSIVLDRAIVTSNGLQYLRNTNMEFITLQPGWNEFSISGASSAKIAFDFPFYYY